MHPRESRVSAISAQLRGGRAFASRNVVLIAFSVIWIASAVYLFVRSSSLFFSSLSLVATLVIVALGLTDRKSVV